MSLTSTSDRAVGQSPASDVRSGRVSAAALAILIATQTAACSFTRSSRVALDPDQERTTEERAIQFAAGEIRALDHPDFEKDGAGVYFLEPYDTNRIPVLFIHGIGGTPRDFRQMIESLDRSRFQPWIFHYPTGLRLRTVVRILQSLVDDLRYKHRFDALFVTAHSVGGLVARGYVESALNAGDRQFVKLLVTFSSPWEGHRWAAVGTRYMPSPVPSWFDLSPGSKFLISLREPLQQGGHRIPHYVFFGFQRSLSVISSESSDGVISMASQLPMWVQDQAERYWGYDVAHTAILSNDEALKRYEWLLKLEADRLTCIQCMPTIQ